MHRVHAGHHFQPHDWRKAAVAQLGLDQRQQIVGLVLVALGIGVARDAEQLVRVDQHRGKQQIEIVRDHVLEPHEIVFVADPQKARDAEADRHFDPRHQRVRVVLVARRDQQIERQVRHERERMGRVHRLRRHQRKNVLVVVVANRFALFVREAGVEPHANAVVFELAQNMRTDLALALLDLAHHRVALVDLLLRRAPVDRQLMHPGDDLLLQAADALHEKLVEIGRRDRQELEPLEQRIALVFGLVQNASIEREPRQLAIEEQVGRREVLVDMRRRRLLDRRHRLRRSPRPPCVASRNRPPLHFEAQAHRRPSSPQLFHDYPVDWPSAHPTPSSPSSRPKHSSRPRAHCLSRLSHSANT